MAKKCAFHKHTWIINDFRVSYQPSGEGTFPWIECISYKMKDQQNFKQVLHKSLNDMFKEIRIVQIYKVFVNRFVQIIRHRRLPGVSLTR
ncbi:MAG: hypothetical protein EBU08_16340 [Micrococcales bacterium]|nr:hypothetical protein [Micrococcales bacterium]